MTPNIRYNTYAVSFCYLSFCEGKETRKPGFSHNQASRSARKLYHALAVGVSEIPGQKESCL